MHGQTIGWGTLALTDAGPAQSKRRTGLNWFLIPLLTGPVATFVLVPFAIDHNSRTEAWQFSLLRPVVNNNDLIQMRAQHRAEFLVCRMWQIFCPISFTKKRHNKAVREPF